VVRARLHLGQEAERQQLDPGKHEQDPEEQQRPVGDALMLEVLHVGQPSEHSDTERSHPQSQQPKDLHRPGRVADQELDRHQVQDDADRARDPVLRASVHPRAMVDHVLNDRHAELARDRRQEPVHLAV
jgi:hypothetical protein